MAEISVDTKRLISEILKSTHGNLASYVPVCLKAAAQDPDFFGHLISYNHHKGEVRDSKIALPIIALVALRSKSTLFSSDEDVYVENALAHLADLRPREFLKAIEFGKDQKAPQRLLRRLVERYLIDLEKDHAEWVQAALRHRRALKTLYAKWAFTAPGRAKKDEWPYCRAVLFGTPPAGTVFEVIRNLHRMTPTEIAYNITRYKLPFLVAWNAAGQHRKEPDVVLALMKSMTKNELVINMKRLKGLGVQSVPALRAQLEESLGKAAESKGVHSMLKATRAAQAFEAEGDEKIAGKLRVLQEKQIAKAEPIEGNWLLLADRSASMEKAIELAKQVASILARMVKGKIHLVFFNEESQYYDVTGKTLEEIEAAVKGIRAVSGTSIGVGLGRMLQMQLPVDGIAIISDGCENRLPVFAEKYKEYAKWLDRKPPVYFYQTATDYPPAAKQAYSMTVLKNQSDEELAQFSWRMDAAQIEVQRFDLTSGSDYYALPNLVKTMRVKRYELMDDILSFKLRTLDEVLDRSKAVPVLAAPQPVTA